MLYGFGCYSTVVVPMVKLNCLRGQNVRKYKAPDISGDKSVMCPFVWSESYYSRTYDDDKEEENGHDNNNKNNGDGDGGANTIDHIYKVFIKTQMIAQATLTKSPQENRINSQLIDKVILKQEEHVEVLDIPM